jgi:hypothetical protein
MHVARRTIILILALVIFITAAGAQSLDDPRLDPEERRKAVREQELRWNLREEDMVVQPTTSGFPGAEVFRVLPGQTNELVLASGTRITVPRGSFRLPPGAEVLQAEVIELRHPEDFAFVGVPTNMTENGRPLLLESAGMVRLRFLWNTTEVLLASSARLKLEMAPTAYGDFNVYRRNESGNWDLRGPAAVNRAPSPDCASGDCLSLSTLIFDKIDRSGWWNFDRPTEEFTCIKGSIPGADQVDLRGMGLYRNWVSAGERSKDGRFVMNVMRGEKTKVAGVVAKKDATWIASFPAFDTQTTVTHTKLQEPDFAGCQDIGSAKLERVDPAVLRDKAKFLKAIGWEA